MAKDSQKFHSPYQFIPVTGRIDGEPTPATAYHAGGSEGGIRQGTIPFVRHDRWEAGARSGRIVCRITAKTPLAVGNTQCRDPEGRNATVVHPYRTRHGIALPASSLRGMVASVAEALSQSALRVLEHKVKEEGKKSEEKRYSVRVGLRRPDVPGTLRQAFEHSGGRDVMPNVMPWNASATFGRDGLTPAECLFGVVEEEASVDAGARNLAGRLRFSDAIAVNEVTLGPEVTLKILASPKLPCPVMYFRRRGENGRPVGGYISKTELNLENGDFVPAGRKRYLPPLDADKDAGHWETKNDKSANQKLKVRLLPEESAFYFHVDFENLSEAELGLLLVSLEPLLEPRAPRGSKFVHRLGLGKPLGLGVVELDILGVFFVDRRFRYSAAGLRQPRYHEFWLGEGLPDELCREQGRYRAERACALHHASLQRPMTLDTRHVDEDSLKVLSTIGDPNKVRAPVCYPFSAAEGQKAYGEEKGFKWFGWNERAAKELRQSLAPVEADAPGLPLLSSGTKKVYLSSVPRLADRVALVEKIRAGLNAALNRPVPIREPVFEDHDPPSPDSWRCSIELLAHDAEALSARRYFTIDGREVSLRYDQ